MAVPNKPYGLCGRKATLNTLSGRAQELCESRGGRPGLPVPNKPHGFCVREATLNRILRKAEKKVGRSEDYSLKIQNGKTPLSTHKGVN